MNVTLKPFDFAQAAARAGLNVNGQPLAPKTGAVNGGGWSTQVSSACSATSD